MSVLFASGCTGGPVVAGGGRIAGFPRIVAGSMRGGGYMATALVDLYGGGDFERFDRVLLPEGYRPSDAAEFMCAPHRAYFLRQLNDWKEAIIEEARAATAPR